MRLARLIPVLLVCASASGFAIDRARAAPEIGEAAPALVLTAIDGTSIDLKGKTCRMEQQCHWVNFKKICTYVKVCR
jgi:hypothetical protein